MNLLLLVLLVVLASSVYGQDIEISDYNEFRADEESLRMAQDDAEKMYQQNTYGSALPIASPVPIPTPAASYTPTLPVVAPLPTPVVSYTPTVSAPALPVAAPVPTPAASYTPTLPIAVPSAAVGSVVPQLPSSFYPSAATAGNPTVACTQCTFNSNPSGTYPSIQQTSTTTMLTTTTRPNYASVTSNRPIMQNSPSGNRLPFRRPAVQQHRPLAHHMMQG